MAFAFLNSIIIEPDFPENDDESDVELDPQDLDDDPQDLDDSDTDPPEPQTPDQAPGNRGDVNVDITWSDTLSDVSPLLRPFTGAHGPLHTPQDLDDPFEFFKLFMGDEQIDKIVVETNRYAEQQLKGVDRYWKPVDFSEVCVYLGANIFFGLKKLPATALYWSSDPFWREPAIADVMGRQRFTKINQYVHLADSSQQPARNQTTFDPLYKVRPLLDHVRHQSQALYKPRQKLSVDEGMVGFTGRLAFKQYIKNKPTPWSIKIWCLAESETGYLLNFRVYTGKNETASRHGQGYDVVFSMVQPYLDYHHIVYFDNFFSSPRLAVDLLSRGTYCCGTIRHNRKGWPFPKKKQKKGDVSMKQSGMVVATQWMDKRQINVISTASDPSVTTVSRRTKNGPVNVDIPQAIHDYNSGMSGMFGVDLSDQYRSYYSVGRSGNKWWRYIMWYLVQVSIINAYHLMKSTRPDAPRETPASSHLLFRTAVCKALLMRGASKKKTSEAPAIAGRAKPYSAHHALAKMPGRKRRCFQCSVDGTKMASGRTRETVTGCHLCNVHLHGGACYSKFHEQLKP